MTSSELIEEAQGVPRPRGIRAVLGTSHPIRGVLMVIVATLLFAIGDVTTKYLVTEYNVPLVGAVRYTVHALLMLAIFAPRNGRDLFRTRRTGLVVVRSLCLVASSLLIGMALQLMPVAETVSLVYLSPMLVVLLAWPLLGERVGKVGIAAVIIGFGGVLLIVRPGGGLDPMGVGYVLLAVGANVVYYLLSRILASSEKTIALLFYSAITGTIVFGLMLPWFLYGDPPTLIEVGLFLGLGALSAGGHFFFTAAHRDAPASLTAPISYSQLLWAGLLGWLVFGHLPDLATIAGMAIVATCGVMIAIVSSRAKRA